MSSHEQDVHVLLNGEVFNHQDMRRPLLDAGVRFHTSSDTETVLHAYLAYDLDVVTRMEGQFALAIVDERRGRLVLARDPLGICPLYYVEHQDVVYVASTMEALLAGVPEITWTVDREALGQYLLLRYVLAPRTIIQQIRQVGPAEAIILEGSSKRTVRHWQVTGDTSAGPADQEEELRHVLDLSVRRNASCDVPIAAFLSGGIDSSIIVGLASRSHPTLNTLSIHLDEHSEEETRHALLAARAFGCHHTVYHPEAHEHALARGCLDAMDHPNGARDAVAMFALARHLKQLAPAVKVVLTGTGADELFAGYSSAYFRPRPGSIEAQCAGYVQAYACTSPEAWRALGEVVVDPLPVDGVACDLAQRMRQLHPAVDAADAINVLCTFYLVCHLPGWELGVQDTMCMASSLEPRVPFLGPRVVDLAMAIRGELKFQPGREKAVLRAAFSGLLPDAIRLRPKLPLSRPVASWLFQHGVHDLYRSVRVRDRGIFHLPRLASLSSLTELDVMWRILALEWWLQRNLD